MASAKDYDFWHDTNGSGLVGVACGDCLVDLGVALERHIALDLAVKADRPSRHQAWCPRRKRKSKAPA